MVKIIDTGKPKVPAVVDTEDQESLEGKLYHLIKDNSAQTDEEACLLLYGEEKLTPNYRMLKSRLRKKLFNSLLFVKLSEEYTTIKNIRYAECMSLLRQTKTIIGLSEFVLADKIADQAVAMALEAELNDLLLMAYDMKQVIDLALKERKKFEQSNKLLQKYIALDAKEREATVVYNKLKFEVSLNISNSRKQHESYKATLSILEKLWKDTGSSKIYDFYFILSIGQCEAYGDYEGILEEVKQTEHLLSSGQINEHWFNRRFISFIKVYALLMLNKLEEGLLSAEQSIPLFKEGTSHWFSFLENYLTLALHKKDYNLSVQLASKVVKNNVFEFPIPSVRERWGLYLRYVLLIAHKSLPEPELEAKVFLTEAANITKDKEGLNLPLMILDYLERLAVLDEEDLEQYTARFSKYATKYLKGEKEERARLFVKMLIFSMKEKGEELEHKAVALLQKLKSTPSPRDPFGVVEIIPYEHLWELVLERLQQRVKK